ncbi:MAG: exodeoxyribonuclease VII small subunit [Bacteroidetes bacterium]|nr:MAG: exodeoxyribonuclease VII small subunit [Bacteroidota bacterium]
MDKPEFSLETELEALRQLLKRMQQEVHDFDQQVALYQQGMTLIGRCREYLDTSELEVQQLIEGERRPFPESEA